MPGKIKSIMVGFCSRCGKRLARPAPCTHAVCGCSNPAILVPLKEERKV